MNLKRLTWTYSLMAACLATGLVLLFALPTVGDDGTASEAEPLSMLVYSRTMGFRHASIEDGVKMLETLCAEHGYSMQHTEDPALFTDESLSNFDVIVFLSTTGDVLDDTQQQAFQRFIQNGGGFVGIHAASDTEYGWPWFGKLVGGYFAGHPKVQEATIHITAPDHVCNHGLPNPWVRTDEWYNFKNIQPDLTILAKLDESTYEGGKMGDNHPISWCHEFDGGRAFYTGMGHTRQSFTEPLFVQHVHQGIRWAAGLACNK